MIAAFVAFFVFFSFDLPDAVSGAIPKTIPVIQTTIMTAVADPARYPTKTQITWSFTLANKTQHVISQAEFWTWAPVKQTAYQQCRNIESSHGFQLIPDDAGNQMLFYQFDQIPPYGARVVSISAELGLSQLPRTVPVKPDKTIYLQPEKYMESDHPLIRKTADQLKQSTALETIKATFQWVAQNIRYSVYTSADRGALYALEHGQGDCTEYMYLFSALCRANQIPARGIGGYVCRKNMVLEPAGYHNWAEVWHDNTWQMVDPQKKVMFNPGELYLTFRIIHNRQSSRFGSFHRFGFNGTGLAVRMNATH